MKVLEIHVKTYVKTLILGGIRKNDSQKIYIVLVIKNKRYIFECMLGRWYKKTANNNVNFIKEITLIYIVPARAP